MLGNSHVQFSGGWARATASGYPSCDTKSLTEVFPLKKNDGTARVTGFESRSLNKERL
jgi:hypothetical protein